MVTVNTKVKYNEATIENNIVPMFNRFLSKNKNVNNKIMKQVTNINGFALVTIISMSSQKPCKK